MPCQVRMCIVNSHLHLKLNDDFIFLILCTSSKISFCFLKHIGRATEMMMSTIAIVCQGVTMVQGSTSYHLFGRASTNTGILKKSDSQSHFQPSMLQFFSYLKPALKSSVLFVIHASYIL